MQVRLLEDAYREQWDRFVDTEPAATFFHYSGWARVIEKAFGHRTWFYYAERNGAICGILPLAHMRSRVFGNALISLPFCVYGGVVAGEDEARSRLEEAACNLARDLDVDYLECRNLRPRRTDWPSKALYVTFRREIEAEAERNLQAVPRKQRAMIRKGINAGLTSQLDDSVERFYDIYSQSVRNLGTPVFAKRYFELLRAEFGDACEILTVVSDGAAVNSVMSFYFRDEVLPYYGGGTREARRVAGNDFLYWELMRRACERGVRTFDFGRSKVDSGSYRFKKHWGFEAQPLFYEYYLVRAAGLPDLSPANPKYRLLIECWKRLPLPLTRRLGPLLARNLG
ncbi:MAG: FemAB family XrtA/PEP-CTERM system-associated protein [Gammaproteobacteria bacterium]